MVDAKLVTGLGAGKNIRVKENPMIKNIGFFMQY